MLSEGRLLLISFTAWIALGVFGEAKSQTTDKIYLQNGDIITGTILCMYRNNLRVQTSALGVLRISWDQVGKVRANAFEFQLKLSNNTVITGKLDTMNLSGAIRVTGSSGDYNLATTDVISFYRSGDSRIRRILSSVGIRLKQRKKTNPPSQ